VPPTCLLHCKTYFLSVDFFQRINTPQWTNCTRGLLPSTSKKVVFLISYAKKDVLPGVSFACLSQLRVNSSDRIFMKVLSEMYIWTRKSSLSFRSHPDIYEILTCNFYHCGTVMPIIRLCMISYLDGLRSPGALVVCVSAYKGRSLGSDEPTQQTWRNDSSTGRPTRPAWKSSCHTFIREKAYEGMYDTDCASHQRNLSFCCQFI